MAARRRASGVWEEDKVGESAPVTDAFAPRDRNTREREKKDEEKKKGDKGGTPTLLLPRVVVVVVVVVRSVPGSRRPPAPARLPLPAPVGVVVPTAFGSCMLTMRTERGVGLRPPEKGTGVRG